MFLKKSLGQHFLREKNTLAKEARLLGPMGKTVLEIGPGDGRLTEQLLLAGASRVIAVEKDIALVKVLEEKFSNRPVHIIHADFLELDARKIGKIDRIAGNIPYYISSPIVFRLKEFEFEKALLMVQEEFAKKMVAKPGTSEYGRLSVTSQLFYEVEYVQKVGRNQFFPAPKVDSAIILLEKRQVQDTEALESTIRSIFQHKNRTLRNALLSSGFEKEGIEILGAVLKKRPRELTLEEIKQISEKISQKRPAI
ncbi:MAG: 16S rRNA (adenine(1518)-N(6)/adenine(1519)-N(6))-dimethyltransferase RsmA [Candidatus ainarchaeum sp.]|nr:16S rRNA (adenine(1518)-N(6)/adenine(1519)-N(6))-dimethyltransferase RsmA [Candidatus ainarchaeum sp.]